MNDTARPLPRFVQLHALTSYPGVLLNRDDAGLAKRMPFGGGVRTRVSSQALKRRWRMAEDAHGLHAMAQEGSIASERTKIAIEREVTGPLRGSFPDERIDAVQEVMVKAVYGSRATTLPGRWFDHPLNKRSEALKTRQALLLGRPEIDYLATEARRVVDTAKDKGEAKAAAEELFAKGDGRANLIQLREQNVLAAGLEAALFGRMVTSDPRANTDASIHVAHAFTVHAEQAELDYFTAVDDLAPDEETGAAGLFDTEITSGLFYLYVVVDVPLLVSNLTGCARADWSGADTDRDLAARVVENLAHLITTVSVGAKRGSTAPYSYAEFLLAEAGARQPRTLANAFRDPVRAPATPEALERGETLGGRARDALAAELDELDAMFGPHEIRAHAARSTMALGGVPSLPLAGLGDWIATTIRRAETIDPGEAALADA